MKKRILALLCSFVLLCASLTGCGNTTSSDAPVQEPTAQENDVVEDDVVIHIGAMSGPTAMGMLKIMNDSENNAAACNYEFSELATDASAFVAPLSTGELDIAAIPSNLASNLYNKTEGQIQVLAVNTLGVLYLLERGESVNDWADLAGRTIYATGAGAVPEYTIRYLLTAHDLDPDTDVTLTWCSDTTEALSYITESENAIAILPQPFVTAAKAKVEDLRVVLDLNAEWDALETGCNITTGVVVARTDFINEHPQAVEAFLAEYEESVNYTLNNMDEAAALMEQYGIVAKAPIANAALPNCHITFLKGSDMKSALEGFLQILFDQNPQSVGNALPAADFYYGAN